MAANIPSLSQRRDHLMQSSTEGASSIASGGDGGSNGVAHSSRSASSQSSDLGGDTVDYRSPPPSSQDVFPDYVQSNTQRPANIKSATALRPNMDCDFTPSLPLNVHETWNWIQDETKIVVKPAMEPVEPSSDIYPMTSGRRGICMIINNMGFENRVVGDREGSDHDAERLKKVFEQLGFVVGVRLNVDNGNMKELLKFLKDVPLIKEGKSEAFVMIILTHGREGELLMADNIYIREKELIDEFSNEKCPGLAGKPKLFFIQACRGDKATRGVMLGRVDTNGCPVSVPVSDSYRPHRPSGGDHRADIDTFTASLAQTMKEIQETEREYQRHTHSDILVSHSTLSGYKSWRRIPCVTHAADPNGASNGDSSSATGLLHGSWYVTGLVAMLCHFARSHSIQQILNRVDQFVHDCVSDEGYKQVCSVFLEGWSRELYFNPGHPPPPPPSSDADLDDLLMSNLDPRTIAAEPAEEFPQSFVAHIANSQSAQVPPELSGPAQNGDGPQPEQPLMDKDIDYSSDEEDLESR